MCQTIQTNTLSVNIYDDLGKLVHVVELPNPVPSFCRSFNDDFSDLTGLRAEPANELGGQP